MESIPKSDLPGNAILTMGTTEFAGQLYRWLGGCLRIDNMTIVAFFSNRQPEVFLAQAAERRVFERMNSHYVTGAYLLDPFYTLHVNGWADGLYRLADIALLILQWHSSVSVGLTLGISPQTEKVIRKQLYRKGAISSLGELYYLIAPHLSGNAQPQAKQA